MTLRCNKLFLTKYLCAAKQFYICVTSDLRREVDYIYIYIYIYICAHLDYYAA